MLLVGVCVSVIQRNDGRKLSVDVGGYKRLHALSVTITAVILLPWVTIQLVTQSVSFPSFHSIGILVVLGLIQAADFYVMTIASQRVEPAKVSRMASLMSFIVALVMAGLSWYSYPGNSKGEEHGLSVGAVMATIFFLVATVTLSHPTGRSSSYSLVGYSSAGLPLYSTHRSSSQLTYASILSTVREGLTQIMADSNSRRIFYFLLLNLVGVVSDVSFLLFHVSIPGIHWCRDVVWNVDKQSGFDLRWFPYVV